MAGKVELTSGLWSGHYLQHGKKYPQKMTLEFADGLMRGDGMDELGAFRVEGEYRVAYGEVRLGWIKTYEGAHSVLYLGLLSSGRIRGKWHIDSLRDSFSLSPAASDRGRDERSR